MNILSLGTPLFSSYWRASGHRVLVLADIAKCNHADNLAFDFFSRPDTCARRFGAIVDRYKPDVIFQGDHSTPLIHCGLEDIDVPKAWYSIDSHLHMSWHKHYAVLFDRVFVAQKSLVPHMARYQPRAYWLPPFCQRTAEFMAWAEREHDVAFVGTLDRARNPERVRLFDALRRSGISLHLAAGAYQPVYRSSRIAINQAVKDDLNLRVFEAMGCGSLLVTDRISHSLHELFDEGRDYCAYTPGDAEDCAQKILWALKHPVEAECIARSGHAKTIDRHCETHRAGQALNKSNVALLNALLSQIAEVPEDREFRVRHACLCMASLFLTGKSAEAQKLAETSSMEFPDAEEIGEAARVICSAYSSS